MTIEELTKIAEQKNAIYKEKHDALIKHIDGIFHYMLPAEFNSIVDIYVNSSSAQIEVKRRDMHHGHSFDLYYHPTYGSKPRKLEMNFGCFGSFKANDEDAINYCKLIGHFASHLAEIEQKLIFSEEGKKAFDEYDAASNENFRAAEDVRKFEFAKQNEEAEACKREIAKKIVVGAKVQVGLNYYHEPIIREIASMTAKNIVFKNECKRTKKTYLIDNIFESNWKFV